MSCISFPQTEGKRGTHLISIEMWSGIQLASFNFSQIHQVGSFFWARLKACQISLQKLHMGKFWRALSGVTHLNLILRWGRCLYKYCYYPLIFFCVSATVLFFFGWGQGVVGLGGCFWGVAVILLLEVKWKFHKNETFLIGLQVHKNVQCNHSL